MYDGDDDDNDDDNDDNDDNNDNEDDDDGSDQHSIFFSLCKSNLMCRAAKLV